MKKYKILGEILLSFIVGHDQKDYILDNGSLEVLGRNIVFIDRQNRRFESITTVNAIPIFLKQGLIKQETP